MMSYSNIFHYTRESSAFILIIALELVYILVSVLPVAPVIRTFLAFPCLFIVPGLTLLVALRGDKHSLVKLVTLGFFFSTIILVILSSLLLALKLVLLPSTYSLALGILVLPLALFCILKRRRIRVKQTDLGLVIFACILSLPLLLYFSQIPRFFSPDETTYISNALFGLLEWGVPPASMMVYPDTSGLMVMINGRYFWIYLLLAFITSTGVHATNAGLLGIFFLIMTALASSLLVRNKWLSTAVFGIVLISPLLFMVSAMALNDLAIAFYAVFAAYFFITAFRKTNNTIAISVTNLFFALLGVIVLAFVKINILILAGMWLILVTILIRYKLYKANLKLKLLLAVSVLPLLIYEFCLDIPYTISHWLGNTALAGVFGRFVFVSPASKILGWFLAPWWNPTAPTLFTRTPIEYIGYFYILLTPETIGILFSAVILTLPVLLISQDIRRKFSTTVLAFLTVLSFYLYYFDALALIVPTDVNRYSLWMIPLWIPLTFRVLQEIKDNPRLRYFIPLFVGMLILLYLNTILISVEGVILIGYALPFKLWTTDVIIIQLISFSVILGLLLLQRIPLSVNLSIGRLSKVPKSLSVRTAAVLILILLALNSIAFNSLFVNNSILYDERGFTEINEAITNCTDEDNLVFANNYIFMRPYIDTDLFRQGLLLPPPATMDEFQTLLEATPNNTLFLVSDDKYTTWYEYANSYIKRYVYANYIFPDLSQVSEPPELNLPNPWAVLPFDDANDTTVLDHSGLGNHGQNYGALRAQGVGGAALQFNGNEYVSIPNPTPSPQENLTISFFARIEEGEPNTDYVILSKGYTPSDGSYLILIRNERLYFSLGFVGSLWVPVVPYLDLWHHFLFTYNGINMTIYVNGVSIASKSANGLIRDSSYDLEIGRDSGRQDYYFKGCIDELQISNELFNHSVASEALPPYYASQVQALPLPSGLTRVFRVFNKIRGGASSIGITEPAIGIDNNRSIEIRLQVDSLTTQNVTFLFGTDRFTRVYTRPIFPGHNDLEFRFDYISDPAWRQEGGPYWRHMSQVRLLVLENNTVVHNSFLLLHNPEIINGFLLPLFLSLLVTGLVVFYFGRRKSVPSET